MSERIDLNTIETEEIIKIDEPVSKEEQKLYDIIVNLDVEKPEEVLKKFRKYYNLLIKWNNVMNLTAITEYSEVIEKHFVDSLEFFNVYQKVDEKDLSKIRLIDIGTGAGFPGIPIAIVDKCKDITLLDSLNKRIDFLNAVVKELGLRNITTIHGRSEEMGRDKNLREAFDIAVSRAVANMSTLSEYCIPFVKKGGYFIAYKTSNNEEEINESKGAIQKLGGVITETIYKNVDNLNSDRAYLFVKKEKETPKKYPRKPGEPGKNSLK